jgi:SAM-dependent methyltransferase
MKQLAEDTRAGVKLAAAPISALERATYRPASREACHEALRHYFDSFALVRDQWRARNRGYHDELERLFRFHVPPDSSVLEIGCSTGELLAALKPSRGVGVDLSPELIARAKDKFPQLEFHTGAFENFSESPGKFDYIVLSDLLGFVYNIRELFQCIAKFCHARTRVIISIHSRLWQPVLGMAESLGLKYRQPVLNWVTTEDVVNLLAVSGFEVVSTDRRILCPSRIPGAARLMNALGAFWPANVFNLTNWIVARLPVPLEDKPSVSVIIPCRNEEGNIPAAINRLPRMGRHTEVIFVEGNSKDQTWEACLRAKEEHPEWEITVLKQPGKGKKDAVLTGFAKAKGDVLMILDADLTVEPEALPEFYDAIASGRVEFANGSRLVYAMEGQAMRFLNLLGNKFFSYAFSFLIGQHVKDTLCGTKVMLRSDYEQLEKGRAHFGDFDPFGDFDLLFGAAKLGLKISDIPVRYRDRVYGETQISRFRHGWMLLKMCGVGLFRLKIR